MKPKPEGKKELKASNRIIRGRCTRPHCYSIHSKLYFKDSMTLIAVSVACTVLHQLKCSFYLINRFSITGYIYYSKEKQTLSICSFNVKKELVELKNKNTKNEKKRYVQQILFSQKTNLLILFMI